MHQKNELREYIYWMRHRISPQGLPGWLHYRVLCDYIRYEISCGRVTYEELGLAGDLALLQLEFSCVKAAIAAGYDSFVENGLMLALDAQIRRLHGEIVGNFEDDMILEFLEDEARLAA